MPRRVTARLVAGAGLVLAVYLYGRNWWYTGVVYLLFHVVGVGGLAGVSFLLRDGDGDGASRAMSTLAMTLPAASWVGAALAVASKGDDDSALGDGTWGDSPALVASELQHGWYVWLPLIVVVVASLARRRTALAHLGSARALASCTAVASAPLLLVPGAAAFAREFMRGGAATLFVYPLLAACIATAWSWLRGSTSSLRRALRGFAPPLAVVGVVVATLLTWLAGSGESWFERWPVDAGAYGSWTYDWSIVSLQRLGGVLVLIAVAVFHAEDPEPRVVAPPELGRFHPPDKSLADHRRVTHSQSEDDTHE